MKNIIVLMFVALQACAQTGNSGGKADMKLSAYFCEACNNACDTIVYAKAGRCTHCGMKLTVRKIEEVEMIKASFSKPLTVAIFVHDGVELLDFAGPGEVFSQAGFKVFTVGMTDKPIISQGFLRVTPQYSFQNCPKPDVLVLPGGDSGLPMGDKDFIKWVKNIVPQTQITLSVCTGAGILSKAGLLDGKTVTTFHNFIDELQRITPKATVKKDVRFVDNGAIITTAGISAGIDGALYVVVKLKGAEAAEAAALNMEYDKWHKEEGLILSEK